MTPAWTLCDPDSPLWPEQLQELYAGLERSRLAPVPRYFVQTTFVRMGGRVAVLHDGAELLALGLLFPRDVAAGRPVYTLRLHTLAPLPAHHEPTAALETLLAPARVVSFRPEQGPLPGASHSAVEGFDLGAPEAAELPEIRRLHAAIWGGSDSETYPDDLHHPAFAPGTSLAARRDGQLVGFLLGFHRFALPALTGLGLPYRLDLAIESQVMGVEPSCRRFGLAATLKGEQARQALARGIDLIHWTVDPLQFPNALLNFGKLRAVAGEFTPNYYPYRNALNRLPASRLGISWLPRSARGRLGAGGAPRERGGLERFPGVALLNAGPQALAAAPNAPFLALEIPADWTALQREQPDLAAAWRATSDELLAAHLGYGPGHYVAMDAAQDGERRYLIAQRFSPELLLP